jgi:hypothetical protein
MQFLPQVFNQVSLLGYQFCVCTNYSILIFLRNYGKRNSVNGLVKQKYLCENFIMHVVRG